MNTDFPLKAQDAIIGDVIIYPEMDMSPDWLVLQYFYALLFGNYVFIKELWLIQNFKCPLKI